MGLTRSRQTPKNESLWIICKIRRNLCCQAVRWIKRRCTSFYRQRRHNTWSKITPKNDSEFEISWLNSRVPNANLPYNERHQSQFHSRSDKSIAKENIEKICQCAHESSQQRWISLLGKSKTSNQNLHHGVFLAILQNDTWRYSPKLDDQISWDIC